MKRKLSGSGFQVVFDINGREAVEAEPIISALGRSSLEQYIYCSSAGQCVRVWGPIRAEGMEGRCRWGRCRYSGSAVVREGRTLSCSCQRGKSRGSNRGSEGQYNCCRAQHRLRGTRIEVIVGGAAVGKWQIS